MDALVTAISSRRRNVWTMMWLGLGGIALASGWVLHVPASQDVRCEGGQEAFADAWGPERAQALRGAFEGASKTSGTRSATAVTASLDAWSQAWLTQHREACEATRVQQTQSDAMLDRRMRCLERRRRELVALVDALGDADATGVERAEDAVDALVAPQRCGDAAFLDAVTEPPNDPEVAREVDDLRAELAAIDAAQELGQPEVALQRAKALGERVEATEYAPLRAELAYAVGQLHFEVGDKDASQAELERAYFGARRASDAVTAANAALHLASLDITFGTEFAQGEHWLRLAEAEVDSRGLKEESITLADMRITLHERRGDLDRAITEVEALLERLAPECGEGCEQLPDVHLTAAHLYSAVARYDEAITHARRAVELEEQRHGDDHPHVARALMRLGDVLQNSRRYDEAHPLLARALEIRERALGPDHYATAIARVELGVILVALERGDEGIAQLEQALGAIRKMGEKQALAATLNQVGWAYGEVGRNADAMAVYAESADIMKALYPEGHPTLAILLSNIAGEAGELGDHEAARAGYEEALAMRRRLVQGHDPQLATFLLNLGRTLQELGRDDEAAAKFRDALELLRSEPVDFVDVRARAWLAEILRAKDPAAADALLAEGRKRCAAADEATRAAADCGRIE